MLYLADNNALFCTARPYIKIKMEYKEFKENVESLNDHQRQVVIILYLKDIVDMMLSFLEHEGIEPKHYSRSK